MSEGLTFEYHGKPLDVVCHMYNCTWLNERGAELAVFASWTAATGSMLEVGNVLSHYGLGSPRRIVDRYEQGDGVENIDVFDIDGRFDEIVAISTLEHVRWDEEPREPGGSGAALLHLQGLLNPGGRMLVTVPTGHNPPLDDWLLWGTGADRACTLVRDMTSWRQTPEVEIRPYGLTQPWAEAVWIGEFTCAP